jgi:hypothetical protein
MLIALAVATLSLGWQDAPKDRVDDALGMRQLFVPFDQIEKFRDPASTYQTMRYDAFLDLLRSAEAALRSRRFIGPSAGTLTGRVDPEGRRIVGTSAWSFPKGHSGVVELRPWNLRVLGVRERARSTRPDWGSTADGALVIRGLSEDAKTVDVDWELPGDDLDRRWIVRGQTPKCSSSRIQLDYPAEWRAWAAASMESTSTTVGAKRVELRSSGESSWSFELTPPGLLDGERPLLSWRGESTFRFGPTRTDVELRAIFQIDRERESAIRVRVPASLGGLSLASVGATAQWKRERLPNDVVQWTAEFRRPPLGSVQILATGSMPTPTGRVWPLESLSAPDAAFRGERVEVVVDPSLRVLAVDPAGLSRRDFRVESGAGRWSFVGVAGSKRPFVHFDAKRTETEVAVKNFLDVGRDRLRWAARLDWSCVRGDVSQPTVVAPAGWRVVKSTVEPAARARGVATSETDDDGRLRISFPLSRPMTTGEKLQTTVQFERTTADLSGAESVAFPELLAVDAASVGRSAYSVRLDPTTSFRLSGDALQWTITASAAGAPPANWTWDSDVARFQYSPPLTNAALSGMQTRRFAFDAEVVQVLRDRWDGWEHQTTIIATPRSGEVGWIDVETSEPIPADARWIWNGAEDAGGDVQEIPSPQRPERKRYRIPPRAGSDGRIQIQAAWRTKGPKAEVGRVAVPDAERSSHRASVVAPESRRIDVAAVGWAEETGAAAVDPEAEDEAVRWSGRLERAEGEAKLTVRKVESLAGAASGSDVQGFVQVTGGKGRRLFHVVWTLASDSAKPLELGVPGDARLWSAALDGQPVAAWIHVAGDGGKSIVFAEPIPSGVRRLELVFEGASERKDEIAFPSVRTPWSLGHVLWRIDADDFDAHGDWDRHAVGALRWAAGNAVSLDAQAAAVASGRSADIEFSARRVAQLLRFGPETLGLDQADDVIEALAALQGRLPSGWLLVVERAAVASISNSGGSLPPPTVEAWLTGAGLHPTLGANVVMLTSRPLESAALHRGVVEPASEFAERKAQELRESGVEPWGAFATASDLLAGNGSAVRSVAAPMGSESSVAVYFRGDGMPSAAIQSPREWKQAAAIFGVFLGVAVAAGLWFARQPLAVAVGASAAGFAVSFVVADGLAAGSSGFAWGSLAASLVWGLRPYMTALRGTAAATVCLAVLSQESRAGDERTAIIPYDPSRLDAPLNSVEVPEPLLRSLRAAADDLSSSLRISSADYRGVVANDVIEWKATFDVVAAGKEPTVKSPVGFIGVDVRSVEIGEKKAAFLAPTDVLPLVVTTPTTLKQRMTIAFRTPIVVGESNSSVSFSLPAAAQQKFLLEGFVKPIELDRTPESRGFAVESAGGATSIVGFRGLTPLLMLAWRERTPPQPLLKATSVSSFKPEARSAAWDVQTHFRWDRSPVARSLLIPLPEGLVVRRVEAPALVKWSIGVDSAGVKQINALIGPEAEVGALSIHAWHLPADPKNFSPPFLAPEGASVRGSAALQLPSDGGMEVAVGRGVKEIADAELRENWRTATAYQPPDGEMKAFAFTEADHAIEIRTKRGSDPLRVTQEHSVSVAPHGGEASWNSTLRLTSVDSVEAVVLVLPAEVVVDRVESASLFQWFAKKNELHVRFDRPMTGAWNVTIQARSRSAKRDSPERLFSLVPFSPNGATKGPVSWTVSGERGGSLKVSNKLPSSCRVQQTPTESRIDGPAEDAAVEMTFSPAASSTHVRQAVVVRRRAERWEVNGRMDFECEGAPPTQWEVLTPRRLDPLEWSAPSMRIEDAGLQNEQRRWIVATRSSAPQSESSAEWRAAPPLAPGASRHRLASPFAQVVGAASQESWIVPSSTQSLEVASDGFESAEPPDWLQAMTNALGEADGGAWFSVDANSRIELSAAAESAPAKRPSVGGWMDVVESANGRRKGRSVWWASGSVERLNLSLPSGCTVTSLQVDGRPTSAFVVEGQALPIRIDSRTQRRRIELDWTAPGADLPSFRDADVGRTLVRVRSPHGLEESSDKIPRSDWLMRLLERECGEWLATTGASGAPPDGKTNLAFLVQAAKDAAGSQASRVEGFWSEFIDKVAAQHGDEAAYRLSNSFDVGSGEPPLESAGGGHAVDHFDFASTPALPAALSVGKSPPRPSRSWWPVAYLLAAAIAAGLSFKASKPG